MPRLKVKVLTAYITALTGRLQQKLQLNARRSGVIPTAHRSAHAYQSPSLGAHLSSPVAGNAHARQCLLSTLKPAACCHGSRRSPPIKSTFTGFAPVAVVHSEGHGADMLLELVIPRLL